MDFNLETPRTIIRNLVSTKALSDTPIEHLEKFHEAVHDKVTSTVSGKSNKRKHVDPENKIGDLVLNLKTPRTVISEILDCNSLSSISPEIQSVSAPTTPENNVGRESKVPATVPRRSSRLSNGGSSMSPYMSSNSRSCSSASKEKSFESRISVSSKVESITNVSKVKKRNPRLSLFMKGVKNRLSSNESTASSVFEPQQENTDGRNQSKQDNTSLSLAGDHTLFNVKQGNRFQLRKEVRLSEFERQNVKKSKRERQPRLSMFMRGVDGRLDQSGANSNSLMSNSNSSSVPIETHFTDDDEQQNVQRRDEGHQQIAQSTEKELFKTPEIPTAKHSAIQANDDTSMSLGGDSTLFNDEPQNRFELRKKVRLSEFERQDLKKSKNPRQTRLSTFIRGVDGRLDQSRTDTENLVPDDAQHSSPTEENTAGKHFKKSNTQKSDGNHQTDDSTEKETFKTPEIPRNAVSSNNLSQADETTSVAMDPSNRFQFRKQPRLSEYELKDQHKNRLSAFIHAVDDRLDNTSQSMHNIEDDQQAKSSPNSTSSKNSSPSTNDSANQQPDIHDDNPLNHSGPDDNLPHDDNPADSTESEDSNDDVEERETSSEKQDENADPNRVSQSLNKSKNGLNSSKNKRKSITRKKRSSNTVFPAKLTKHFFSRFVNFRVSSDAYKTLEQCSEKYHKWVSDQLFDTCKKNNNKIIKGADVVALMKRQGFVKNIDAIFSFAERNFPMELQSEIIPVAGPGNSLFPSFK